MTPLIVAVVLGSALLHASWNALLKSGADRLWSISIMGAGYALMALPFALALPAPDRASWPMLVVSASFQVGYCYALVRAYDAGDLAQVYPIARGSSPLLVTVGAAMLVDERLTALSYAGVFLVSAGIVGTLAGKGALPRRALVAALITGALIACYTVVDGIGARASKNVLSYALWLFVLHGVAMQILYRIMRGRFPHLAPPKEMAKAAGAAVASAGAYGAVVWAMSQSPMGATSALRETSVLFAAVLGSVMLGERMTILRFTSCAAIAAGACCLALAR